jgi:lactate racemase
MDVPDGLLRSAVLLGTLGSAAPLPALTAEQIESALRVGIWPDNSQRTAFDIVQPGESVCLVVSDHTRKTATDLILPPLLKGLNERGCACRDMFVLFASGIHRHPTPDEVTRILGAAVAREFAGRIFFHDPDDSRQHVEVGVTRRGHRVRISRRAMEADRLVLIGAANYHYHAGFGGGRKSLVPGLAARDTIAYNHSLTLDPVRDAIHHGVQIGKLDGNPVAEEMLESASMCRPDIVVITVLSPSGELASLFTGHLDAAHRAACRQVERVDRVNLTVPADFVIASAGRARNWIQSHKSLFNAHRAIRNGGCIILIAPCPEGLGDEKFRQWVRMRHLPDIYKGLRQSAEILGQTALSTHIRGKQTILVTEMPQQDREDLGLETAPDLESAVSMVIRRMAGLGIDRPSYYLMPEAGQTVPFLA